MWLIGYPIVNDPLYNHPVFGPEKGKGGLIGKTDDQLIQELISIHNAENWLGVEGEDGGGGGGDIFGSGGATGPAGVLGPAGIAAIGNDVSCHHLNTASGPSSCTSVQSDNGSSVGSMIGDGIAAASTPVSMENDGIGGGFSAPLGAVGNNECPVQDKVENNFGSKTERQGTVAVMNGGKVTVGTQTSEEEPTEGGTKDITSLENNAETGLASPAEKEVVSVSTGADCVSSGSQTPSVAITASDSKSIISIAAAAAGDNNNSTPVSITIKSCGPPGFKNDLMTYDPHCYECKVRYRDPKPKDLVMYLHALTYKVCVAYEVSRTIYILKQERVFTFFINSHRGLDGATKRKCQHGRLLTGLSQRNFNDNTKF